VGTSPAAAPCFRKPGKSVLDYEHRYCLGNDLTSALTSALTIYVFGNGATQNHSCRNTVISFVDGPAVASSSDNIKYEGGVLGLAARPLLEKNLLFIFLALLVLLVTRAHNYLLLSYCSVLLVVVQK